MKTTTDLKWYEALDAMYGANLSDKQIEVWQAYLRSANASNEELRGAIEMAAGESIKTEEWKVTVRDLTKWLKIYRKRVLASDDRAQQTAMVRAFVFEWKERIERGAKNGDFLDALYIFCSDNSIGTKDENEIAGKVMGR